MPKKTIKDPLDKNKNKLDLGSTLSAIDMKNKDYYNNLEDQEKKQYAPFVLMRFLSSATDQSGLHQFHCLAVNDIVNTDFWTLSKYPDFQHLLMCLVGLGKKQFHQWIPNPKKKNSDKVKEFLQRVHPSINDIEIKLFLRNNTIEEFKQLCRDYALEDKEIKPLADSYESLKTE